ncbi:MAG: hypothetical protein ACK4M9_17200 [Anaerobacillus sp.]|uniref:hypothetical protein n=1 Tax=Anaerobacillus sp. TaxID=1872506 RepID=UPI003918B099
MKRLVFMLVVLIGIQYPVNSTMGNNFEFTNNQDKAFISEDGFYKELNKDIYEEFKNASYSIRKKISYIEVPEAENFFKMKTKLNCEEKITLQTTNIHPDRQVYFFASFMQDEKEEHHKYTVIDAETNRVLLSGKSYHQYDNLYEKPK